MTLHYNTKNTYTNNKISLSNKIQLDFSCKVSYSDFNEGYEKYKRYTNPEIVVKYNENFELHKSAILWYCQNDLLEPIKIENQQLVFNAVNYIRFFIIATIANFGDYDSKIQNEIGLMLMSDVTDIYSAEGKIGCEFIKILEHYFLSQNMRFNLYTDYIKYRHNTEYKGNLSYKKRRVDLAEKKIKDSPVMGKKLNNIKYERKLEKNDILSYLIYCTLFLGENLYIVYYDNNEGFNYNVYITDKKHLGNYLRLGVYTLDISEIIINFYNAVVQQPFEGKNFLELAQKKKKSEQEWNVLFNNILEDLKGKNKITFNIESKNEFPTFMSSKWTEQGLNKYKLIESELGQNGEITKKKNKGKRNALGIVKRRTYGDKNQ